MKNLYKILYIPGIFTILSVISCEEDPVYEELTSSMEGVQLYISQAERVHSLETYSIEEMAATEPDTITFNVGYGGLKLPASPIPVTIKINEQVIDSLNQARQINGEQPYVAFPENAYTLSTSSVSISKGEMYSDFIDLVYYPEQFDIAKNYLLALEMETTSGYALNPDKSIILFEVREVIMPEPEPNYYDKSSWEVIAFSSEEDEGEGENGFASLIIDGNPDSFWHTCWLGCSEEESNFPHEITVDMKEVSTVDGFEFLQRQSGTRAIKDLELLISDDGQEWTSLGDFTLLNMIAPQQVALEETTSFRFFKIITKSAHDGTNFSALGEVNLYLME